LLGKAESVTGSALVADEAPTLVLVVKPEAILAMTDRARAVLVLKVVPVDPKLGKD
jgi:hypothetical protein